MTEEHTESQASTVAAPSEQETPATSQAPSEADEQPATPSSAVRPALGSNHARAPTRPVVPIVPKVPASAARKQSSASRTETSKDAALVLSPPVSEAAKSTDTAVPDAEAASAHENSAPTPSAPKAPPKSWADLVRSKNSASSVTASTSNGVLSSGQSGASNATNMAEAVRAFAVDSAEKVPFIMPRGLVNTGNMCYMNSVSSIIVWRLRLWVMWM